MSRVISFIQSSIWACRSQEFDQLCRVAYRESDNLDAALAFAESADGNQKFETMLAKKGERLNGSRYTQMRENGVAVIDVSGVISKKMNFFAEICGTGTSTEMLMQDLAAAAASPNVSGIVLHIDSPGGEAFGINELAQAIFEMRGKKPLEAYVSGLGCSGAYWIASACDRITCDKSAFLGSIGVVTSWTDDSGFYKALGIQREVVTSSNAQFKRLNLNNDDHRAELQRELDSLESVFHKAVARNRGVSVAQVIEDFNHGGVLSGGTAVKKKMADRTGSLEQVVREMARKGKNQASFGANTEGEFDMGMKDEFKKFASSLGFNVTEDENEEPPTAADPMESGKVSAELSAANARTAAAEKELADFKAEQQKNHSAQTLAQAETFVAAEIAAGRMFPAEKETFASLFTQASADDAASPLASGSRLGNLKTIQAKRKPHGLTAEQLGVETLPVVSGESSESAEIDAAVASQVGDYDSQMSNKPKLKAV